MSGLGDRRAFGSMVRQVAPLCLGGNVFGWTADQETSFAVLDAYVAAGGNFIDSANIYSAWVPGNQGGESERILGDWLKGRGDSGDVIIATKLGMEGGAFRKGLTRDLIRRGVEGSLERLGVDRIDLLYAHEDDAATPLSETMEAFDEVVREGLVEAVAASNYSAARLEESLQVSEQGGYVAFAGLQPHFNLLDRDPEVLAAIDLCDARSLGVAPYFALARGFLAGKYHPGDEIPGTPRAAGVQRDYFNDRGWHMLAAVERIAGERGATAAQVSLAWLMAHPAVTCPIASATSVAQVTELVGAADLVLSDEEFAELDRLGAA